MTSVGAATAPRPRLPSAPLAEGRAVVVEHRRRRARLRPRLDVVRDVLRRECPRPRVVERAAKRREPGPLSEALRQPRELEEEHVPGPASWRGRRRARSIRRGWGPLRTASRSTDLRVVHRRRPGDAAAPVVADQEGALRPALADQVADVGRQQFDAVARRPRGAREVVAAQCPARRRESRPPRAPGSGVASRTRTRGSRAAGRRAGPPLPRRSGAARPRAGRNRPPGRCSRGSSSKRVKPRSPAASRASAFDW